MPREILAGITLKHGDINALMVPFTYGCNSCDASSSCQPSIHPQERPTAIRGKLAGDPEQCLIVRDKRWSTEVEVLKTKRI